MKENRDESRGSLAIFIKGKEKHKWKSLKRDLDRAIMFNAWQTDRQMRFYPAWDKIAKGVKWRQRGAGGRGGGE